MKNIQLALLCAALAVSSAFALSPAESARLSGERQFMAVPQSEPLLEILMGIEAASHSNSIEPAEITVFEQPAIAPLARLETPGKQVGRVKLAELLDRHRNLLTKVLGALTWDISVASDSNFKEKYLTFARAGLLVIKPLGDLNRLRGDGIDVQIDENTIYNFRVKVNFPPTVRNCTLHITPKTAGPKHDPKVGEVLDSVKSKSYVFKAKGTEYWLLHGTDVDPATSQLANTRSLVFVREAGTGSKAWTLAESALTVGQPYTIALGDTKIIALRTPEGELQINETK